FKRTCGTSVVVPVLGRLITFGSTLIHISGGWLSILKSGVIRAKPRTAPGNRKEERVCASAGKSLPLYSSPFPISTKCVSGGKCRHHSQTSSRSGTYKLLFALVINRV